MYRYEPAQFGRVFALLGVASRIGATLSRLYIGALLIITNDDWRWSVRAVSGLGIVGFVIYLYFVFKFLTPFDEVWFAFPYYSKLKEFFNIKTFDSFISTLTGDQEKDMNKSNKVEKQQRVADVVVKQLHCKNVKKSETQVSEQEKKELLKLKDSVLHEITYVVFFYPI